MKPLECTCQPVFHVGESASARSTVQPLYIPRSRGGSQSSSHSSADCRRVTSEHPLFTLKAQLPRQQLALVVPSVGGHDEQRCRCFRVRVKKLKLQGVA